MRPEAGLVHVTDDTPGITRRRAGKGWSYRDAAGARITDRAALARIRSLAIPPAWADVWISPDAAGHVQATGRDGRGRKQYLYHPVFRAVREQAKYAHMVDFARALPAIRTAVDADMGLRGLPRRKVLATVVHLLETTMIRVGNADYARHNRSFGLTTLTNRHVRLDGNALKFRFRGKSGKTWNLSLRDRRIARIVRQCQDLPGQSLFQYRDDDGAVREITSGDVNAYLRETSGADITAKDFRTWTGTVLAALALAERGPCATKAEAQRNVRDAIAAVAANLGNTPTICRKCYVHPQVIEMYLEGTLDLSRRPRPSDALRPEEAAVLALIERRLSGPAARAA